MKNTANKVVLIGCGAVGSSFLYSAVNQGIASDYVLIDAFPNSAEGNAIDIADAKAVLPTPFYSIKAGDYSDCKDADLIVIAAGRPQKPGEPRLDMVAGNAKIMNDIALNVKKSGFSGITILASNPVDVLTLVYQEVTGFEEHKVVGAGTTLDSARLRRLIGEKLGVAPMSVEAFLMGEHGDSSVFAKSVATVMGQPISSFVKAGKITDADLDEAKKEAINMVYKIIDLKRASFYGIGVCLARLAKAVLNDEHATLMCGAKLHGEYGNKGLYTGVPAVISAKGWEYILEWPISKDEQEGFNKSCAAIEEAIVAAHNAIK